LDLVPGVFLCSFWLLFLLLCHPWPPWNALDRFPSTTVSNLP
jgi:hypothetical protein